MLFYFFQKHLVTYTIMQVFTGMYFVTEINACFIKFIKDRQPSFGEFRKPIFHQPGSACGTRLLVRQESSVAAGIYSFGAAARHVSSSLLVASSAYSGPA